MPYKRGTKYIGQIRRNGKKKEKVFQTRKEALAWEVEMRKIPDADWNEKTLTTCLGDWAKAYLDYSKERHVEKTYFEKRLAFKMLLKSMDPTLDVNALTPAMLLDHIRKQMKKRSGYAANKDRKNLIAAWNWGTKFMDPVFKSDNPCIVPKMPEKRTPRYIPPEGDFWKVFHVSTGQDKIMLLTFLHLAARRNEIFRLKVEDLDFANSRARLSTFKREGGNLEYDWLPMTEELKQNLSQWLNERELDSENVFICLDKTAFTREHYGKPFKHRQQLMRRLCDKAGVKHFGFHAIRHLTASCLYKQGHSVGVIQAILRHKSPTTTERYLKTLGLEHVRDALEGLSVPEKPKVKTPKLMVLRKLKKDAENKKAV